MDFQEQAQQHSQIREALLAALTERRALDPALLLTDRLCPTGCWLQGEGARRWAGSHALLGLIETHRAFHHEAAVVAGHVQRGQWTEGQRALRNGSPFALALTDLLAALRRMRAAASSLAA